MRAKNHPAMKSIYSLTEDELVKIAIDSPAVTNALSRKGEFNLKGCVTAALDNIGTYFRKCNGLPSYASLSKEQADELSVFLPQVEPLLWDRLREIRAKHVKQHTITAINFAKASAMIGDALKAAGLQGNIYEQRYRARVEVRLGRLTVVRFYVNYKDLAKSGTTDEVISALVDLRSALDRLGPGVFLRRI